MRDIDSQGTRGILAAGNRDEGAAQTRAADARCCEHRKRSGQSEKYE
jgi:hypothetical protein